MGPCPPGASAPQGRDAAAAVAGVPRSPSRRLPVQPVLRALQGVAGTLAVAMRQVYRAGEKAFVDYAGPTFEVVDAKTGEVRDVMVFVGVLGVGLGASTKSPAHSTEEAPPVRWSIAVAPRRPKCLPCCDRQGGSVLCKANGGAACLNPL